MIPFHLQDSSSGLVVGPNGPIQSTVGGDHPGIGVRLAADGVIANVVTLNSFLQPGGWINIRANKLIAVYYDAVVAALTAINIYPRFSYDRDFGDYPPAAVEVTAATDNLIVKSSWFFNLVPGTTGFPGMFSFCNPGANWLRFYTSSSGVVTGSSLTLIVLRCYNGEPSARIAGPF